MSRTLGAVLAGGLSSRFGSDKALAEYRGRALIEHALAALAPHVDMVAVIGRDLPGTLSIPDRPAPGLGPLGGLAGALHHAQHSGFDHVLSCGVDCIDFPAALLVRSPSFLDAQPVIGLWPAVAAPLLDQFLIDDPRRSVRGFAATIGALPVKTAVPPANINTPEDLATLARGQGPAHK